MNKISIVMPSYNSEKYIEEAINSVINQSYTNWELLIVDDGSTDSTGKIIDSYALKDNRIKVFHTSNYGVSHARNIALDNATGEWINFLDSDDLLPNNALKTLLDNSNGCDMVLGNFDSFPEKKDYKIIFENQSYESSFDLVKNFKDAPFILIFCGLFSLLLRKDIIVGKFEDEYCFAEDLIFFINIFKNIKKINLITDDLYYYRIGNMNSLVHQFPKQNFGVFEKTINFYLDLFDDKEIVKQLYSFYLHFLIKKINTFFDDDSLTENDRKQAIKSLLDNELFHKIFLDNYHLTKLENRLASIILIKDIDMIFNEFKKGSINND